MSHIITEADRDSAICILQYQIEYEEEREDGSVRNVGYEGNAAKE